MKKINFLKFLVRHRMISMHGVLHKNVLHGVFDIFITTNNSNIWKVYGIRYISYVFRAILLVMSVYSTIALYRMSL